MPQDNAPYRWFDTSQDRQRSNIYSQQRAWHRQQRAGRIERLLVWAALICGSVVAWYCVIAMLRCGLEIVR